MISVSTLLFISAGFVLVYGVQARLSRMAAKRAVPASPRLAETEELHPMDSSVMAYTAI